MKPFLLCLAALFMSSFDVIASDLDQFVEEMTIRLLDGGDFSDDMENRVMELSVADRFQAIAFLRRSGLVTGPTWDIDRLLGETLRDKAME